MRARVQSSFLSFAELFVFMLDGGRRRRRPSLSVAPLLLFDDVLRVFTRSLTELERAMAAAGTH